MKHKEHLDYDKVRVVTFLGLLFSLSVTLLVYVSSTYYQEALGSENVGIFYFISSAALLFALLNFHKVVSRFGRARTLLFFLLFQIALFFTLSFLPVSLFGAALLVAYSIATGVIWALWDMVLEAYSVDSASGRIRGMFLSVGSIGSLIGPLVSTTLLEKFGFLSIFTVVLVLYAMMFVVALIMLNSIRGHLTPMNTSVFSTVRSVWRLANVRNIYAVGCVLQFFFAMMTIFMPLYLRSLGISWIEIGWIFAVMLIPYILFEYPAGVLADKKYGEKEILLTGCILIIIAVLCVIFVSSVHIGVWMAILFLSRTGAAFVESMHESYFYKQVDSRDISLINFFRSTRSIGYIVAAALSSITLFFGDLKIVFSVLLVVLFLGLYPVLTLRDTRPERS